MTLVFTQYFFPLDDIFYSLKHSILKKFLNKFIDMLLQRIITLELVATQENLNNIYLIVNH